MKVIKINGTYSDLGKIQLNTEKLIVLSEISDNEFLPIPFGSQVEISISFDEIDFTSGNDGIVWGSYDLRQIEVINNALFAQNIMGEIKTKNIGNRIIHLLHITNKSDVQDSVNFIWKSKSGLRLQPDWNYPVDKPNLSFEQWLGGK